LEETLISCQMHEAKHRRAAQISGRLGVLPSPAALATFSRPIIFAIGVSVSAVRARPCHFGSLGSAAEPATTFASRESVKALRACIPTL